MCLIDLEFNSLIGGKMTDLRYPIGTFALEGEITPERRQQFIAEIAQAPVHLRRAVSGLTPEQIDTAYRSEGWTVRQLVHHLADSHLNSFVRFKLAMTEQEPTIKPYSEKLWAELPDARTAPMEPSLAILESLHLRWVILLKSFRQEDFARTLRHPERGIMTLDLMVAMYAWHGKHHVAHITSLKDRMGWK
jgi:uncharacterized damage-inducible protein DinB